MKVSLDKRLGKLEAIHDKLDADFDDPPMVIPPMGWTAGETEAVLRGLGMRRRGVPAPSLLALSDPFIKKYSKEVSKIRSDYSEGVYHKKPLVEAGTTLDRYSY